jgi:uncharacterized membrane protein
MILQLLGVVALIVFTVFVSRTARENRRSGVGWGLACAGLGLGLQTVIPFALIVVIAIVMTVAGTPADGVQTVLGDWSFAMAFIFIVFSVIAMFLVLRHVAQLPDDDEVDQQEVPPPPTFDGSSR